MRISSTQSLSPEDMIIVIYIGFLFVCWVGWLVCFLVGWDSASSYPRHGISHSPEEPRSFSEEWYLEIRTRAPSCFQSSLDTLPHVYTYTAATHLWGHHVPFSKCTQTLFRNQVLNYSEMNLFVWLPKEDRLEKYHLSNRERNWNQRKIMSPFLFHWN